MSFVRPEARAMLWRVREILFGVVVIALGVYWAIGVGILSYLGLAFIVIGTALGVIGWQRFRFRGAGGGQGLVQVDEGQITYFGPLAGGVVSVADLQAVTLDGASFPKHWILSTTPGDTLHIPVNAEGIEALFDVFAALPGMQTERLLAGLRSDVSVSCILWERRERRPERRRLH